MPEAAEVYKLCEALLKEKFWRKPIIQVEVLHPNLLECSPSEWTSFWEGNVFLTVERKAKFLIFKTKKGPYVAHQRFTGWFNIEDDVVQRVHALNANKTDKVSRLKWHFGDGAKSLVYRDPRCLSVHQIPKNGVLILPLLAPDVLTEKRPFSEFTEYLSHHGRRDLKSILLDQRGFLSGVGNYLAAEILCSACLNPWMKVKDLTESQANILWNEAYAIPELSLKSKNYDWFRVFRRKNCGRCGTAVTRKVHHQGVKDPKQGQASYFCHLCQEVPQ